MKSIPRPIEENKQQKRINRYLIALPTLAFVIKMITMFRIQGGGWYGADGENYFKGVDALYAEGLFSKAEILSYWPAGYPILILLLVLIPIFKFVYLISFLQSLFFAFATYFLTRNLSRSGLVWIAIPSSLIISFNPTLSLSTLSIGYEAPVAACFMMALGIISSSKADSDESKYRFGIIAGTWLALAVFMQPRYLLVGVVLFLFWGATFISRSSAIKVVTFGLIIMMTAPTLLIVRNTVATNVKTISTNLGATMAIGAGDETSGGWERSGPEVPCSFSELNKARNDNQLVSCVINWYFSNPSRTLELVFNKSIFFWSPWSGPLASGTMARNPWLKISPAQYLVEKESSTSLVTGMIGRSVSIIWVIGQLIFLFIGFFSLRKGDQHSKLIGNISFSAVIISWVISTGTIGDHRFRVPTMGLSLLLQVVGLMKFKNFLVKVL